MNAVFDALRELAGGRDHPGQGHFFGPGIYVRELHLPAESAALTHRHADDHISILASGIAEVWVDGRRIRYTAPAVITIKAHTDHAIAAYTDVIWYCIHATNKTTPSEVDAVTLCSGDCRVCGGH